jgi:hypothetical protein
MNLIPQKEMAKIKAEQPDLKHTEAFKLAASRWKNAPENPKRVK